MLKLTIDQLHTALRAAREVEALEGVKDALRDEEVRVELDGGPRSKHNPSGSLLLDVVVTKEVIRAQLAARLGQANQVLADLGIELAA